MRCWRCAARFGVVICNSEAAKLTPTLCGRFTDEQVLAEDFMDKVGEVAAVLRPFVRM